MAQDFGEEFARLRRQSVAELQRRYTDAFGEAAGVGNKAWLVKRIAWQMQALVEGELSEHARRRAADLASDTEIRLTRPRRRPTAPSANKRDGRDGRLPGAGTVLTRRYKGKLLQVTVRADGFVFDGQLFPSLTAVAHAITGAHWNGFRFFGLADGGGR